MLCSFVHSTNWRSTLSYKHEILAAANFWTVWYGISLSLHVTLHLIHKSFRPVHRWQAAPGLPFMELHSKILTWFSPYCYFPRTRVLDQPIIRQLLSVHDSTVPLASYVSHKSATNATAVVLQQRSKQWSNDKRTPPPPTARHPEVSGFVVSAPITRWLLRPHVGYMYVWRQHWANYRPPACNRIPQIPNCQ